MRHDLEQELWDALPVSAPGVSRPGIRARDWISKALADGRIQSAKQAWATLEKWGEWYEYGVNLELGWKTIDGPIPRRRDIVAGNRIQSEEE